MQMTALHPCRASSQLMRPSMKISTRCCTLTQAPRSSTLVEPWSCCGLLWLTVQWPCLVRCPLLAEQARKPSCACINPHAQPPQTHRKAPNMLQSCLPETWQQAPRPASQSQQCHVNIRDEVTRKTYGHPKGLTTPACNSLIAVRPFLFSSFPSLLGAQSSMSSSFLTQTDPNKLLARSRTPNLRMVAG